MPENTHFRTERFELIWWSLELFLGSLKDFLGSFGAPRHQKEAKFIALGLHFNIFGLTFSVLGWSLGPPWGTLDPRPLKTSKKSFFGTSFRGPFLTCFSLFGGDVFNVCSKPLYFHLVPQLGCHLGALWVTFSNIFDVCGVLLDCTPSRAKTYIFRFWSYLVESVCLFFSMSCSRV